MKEVELEPSGYEVFGKLCLAGLAVAASFTSIPLRGWVLSVLWGWFLTPILYMSAPSIMLCTGLVLVCQYLSMAIPTHKEAGEEIHVGIRVAATLLAPLVTLGLGWCVHLFC